jgi:hypothetical protein
MLFDSNDSEIKYYGLLNKKISILFDWRQISNVITLNGAIKEHINHILFSPCGERLIYIHRYWVNQKRYDSLIFFDLNENKLIPILINQVVSHYCWKDSSTIFAWLIINDIPGYYYVNVISKNYQLVYSADDGHPNIIGLDHYITDRNVGSRFVGNILQAEIININNKSSLTLGYLSHPTIFDYSHRCDMHISLSKDMKKYQLDSRHIKNRRMIVIGNIPNLIE